MPQEIHTKHSELAENRKAINNSIKFISEGRFSKAIADSLAIAEQKVERLESELATLEATRQKVFKTPPIEWIAENLNRVKEVLEKKSEKAAHLLRNLLGPITLEPVVPDIGKAYLLARCNFQPACAV